MKEIVVADSGDGGMKRLKEELTGKIQKLDEEGLYTMNALKEEQDDIQESIKRLVDNDTVIINKVKELDALLSQVNKRVTVQPTQPKDQPEHITLKESPEENQDNGAIQKQKSRRKSNISKAKS